MTNREPVFVASSSIKIKMGIFLYFTWEKVLHSRGMDIFSIPRRGRRSINNECNDISLEKDNSLV